MSDVELPLDEKIGNTEASLLTPKTEDNVTIPSFAEPVTYADSKCSASSLPSGWVEPKQKRSSRRRSGFVKPIKHSDPTPVDGECCIDLMLHVLVRVIDWPLVK